MSSIFVRSFSDPDEYRKAVLPAEIQLIVTGRGQFEAKLTQIKLGSFWMQRGVFSLPAIAHSSIPKDRRMFFLQFAAAQAPIRHSGSEIDASEIVCYPLGSEHLYRAAAVYSCGGMSLSQERFAAYEEAFLGHQRPVPSAMRVVRPRPALMSQLLRLHKAVSDLAATAPDILLHPEVGKAIEQQLARSIIACISDIETEETYRPRRLRQTTISRFEQLLCEQPYEKFYLSDVCSQLGVSERALRLHCQEQLDMSPNRYLWLRRMNQARDALAQADPAVKTVTEVATGHGFGELGRFAVSYRKLFGESPSVTLRRAPDHRLDRQTHR
jgi:AraC-like DNA-binding protein